MNAQTSDPHANAFIGQASAPTEAELATVLGEAKPVWDQLLTVLGRECGATTREWNCYSTKAGWSLRIKRKARTIVWLGPRKNAFLVAFILGASAAREARQSQLPRRFAKTLADAPKYPEGFGVRLMVKSAKDIPALRTLAQVKLNN